ncbi:bifunctional 3-(3-hydroxy-phenyl)propionate/3-hydroxycinnamic acid hydroxylase [Rhodococcus koreensis]
MPSDNDRKSPSDLTSDVLIVGAGPTGLVLANILGLQGVRVTIIEERPALIDYPRGVGIDDETVRVFQSTGLIDQILPHTVPNQTLTYVTADGSVLGSFSPTEQPYGWPRKHGFIQPMVDRVLLEGLDRFPDVTVLWGHKAQNLSPDTHGVTVDVEGPGGETFTLRGSYLVGCDGGRSGIRKWMGVSFDGLSSSTRWLVVDIANDPLGTPNAYIVCDPKRPRVSIGLPHGVRRFEFMLFDHEKGDVADPAEVTRLLTPVIPDPENAEIIRSRVYTHHSRVASRFISDRVLIAGDAAHLMPVWQGQGYNSCVRDAGNLGWKLGMVVKGVAGPELLETYDAERRPHARSMVNLSRLTGRFLGITNPLLARIRDGVTRAAGAVPPVRDYFLQMRFKPMPTYRAGGVIGGAGSPAGTLFVQPEVMVPGDDGLVKLDDLIGNRFAIIRWGADPAAALPPEQREAWRALGARFIAVHPMNQLPDKDCTAAVSDTDKGTETIPIGDISGDLRAWFNTHPHPFVVLRPDRIIGTACGTQEAGGQSAALLELLGVRISGTTTSEPLMNELERPGRQR